ncbi:hypothetical protein CSA37_08605 [Candidatus Fermentibacteria bacterium]|nr:MAG: hypothetical protein CSA37_08605 [Candidatus Fermentibacteria bacterium]
MKYLFALTVLTAILSAVACTANQLAVMSGYSTADQMTMMGYQPDYARSPLLDSKPVWRTVVLPPVSSSPANLTDASGLQDYAGMSLMRTSRFSLVDRSVIDQILEEQEFSYSGVADPSTAVELGRLSGAEAVMTINIASVTHDSFWDDEPAQRDALLHVKIISVETSEVLYTSSGRGSDFDGADGALRDAVLMALMGINNQTGSMR